MISGLGLSNKDFLGSAFWGLGFGVWRFDCFLVSRFGFGFLGLFFVLRILIFGLCFCGL